MHGCYFNTEKQRMHREHSGKRENQVEKYCPKFLLELVLIVFFKRVSNTYESNSIRRSG
jgi:hypothetical protein